MTIKLTPEETQLREGIEERVNSAKRAFSEMRLDDGVQKAILEAGERAHRLHMLLKKRGLEPKHHGYMIKNRGLQPDDPQFYEHFHPLQDLLKFIDDPHANDDPVDQTIGETFDFRVFSRRWGHDDSYRITRTAEGWDVHHLAIGGPCDKGGRPFLFENLDQDFISYPSKLDWRMEWLWDQAEKHGLDKANIQQALRQLADWVSTTEKSAPTRGLWDGY
jgi:hypothetical protein